MSSVGTAEHVWVALIILSFIPYIFGVFPVKLTRLISSELQLIKMRVQQSFKRICSWNVCFSGFYMKVTENWESMNICNQLLILSCCFEAARPQLCSSKQNPIWRQSEKWENPIGCWWLVIRKTFLIWQACWLSTLSDFQLWTSGVLVIMLLRGLDLHRNILWDKTRTPWIETLSL